MTIRSSHLAETTIENSIFNGFKDTTKQPSEHLFGRRWSNTKVGPTTIKVFAGDSSAWKILLLD